MLKREKDMQVAAIEQTFGKSAYACLVCERLIANMKLYSYLKLIVCAFHYGYLSALLYVLKVHGQ